MVQPLGRANPVVTGISAGWVCPPPGPPDGDTTACPVPDPFGCDDFCPAPADTGEVPAVSQGLSLHTYPDPSRNPILEAINGAQTAIDVKIYMLTDPALIDGLIEAGRRGVKVRVILEYHPYGADFSNRKAMNALRQAGIEARWSNPQFKYTHEKSMVVDGSAAWIMTANMSKSARLKNREYLVVDANAEDVGEIQKLFDSDWNRVPYIPGAAAGRLVISPNNSRSQILALIDRAQRSLALGFEVIGDPEIQQALITKAREGVKVQVLIADPSHSPNSQVPQVARELQEGGCEVQYLKAPYLHAKVIIADNQAVYLGSVNLTTNSLNNNRELGILASQPDVVAGTVRTFGEDWQSGGPITPGTDSVTVPADPAEATPQPPPSTQPQPIKP